MIEHPAAWVAAGLIAAGIVLAASLRLDPDTPANRRRDARDARDDEEVA